jgi:hypothetical protein
MAVDGFDLMAFVVFGVLLVAAVVIVVTLGSLPGLIAQMRSGRRLRLPAVRRRGQREADVVVDPSPGPCASPYGASPERTSRSSDVESAMTFEYAVLGGFLVVAARAWWLLRGRRDPRCFRAVAAGPGRGFVANLPPTP